MISRQYRKCTRLLIRFVLIATVIWFLLFNAITYIIKSEINELGKKITKHIEDEKLNEFVGKIQRKKYEINCQSIIEWDETEIRNAKRLLFKLRNNSSDNTGRNREHIDLLSDANFIFDQEKCSIFRDKRGYERFKIHQFELTFPIAYTILVYNNVEQFERLLRSIYRPQNVYCIHIDAKSSQAVHLAIKSITNCFPNVFISTKLERIVYAGFERLKADINCMEDLLNFDKRSHLENLIGKNFSRDWKYLLNLASTEFPLRTNYELTRILNVFNGANDIEVMDDFHQDRVKYSWEVRKNPNTREEYLHNTKKLKTPPPYNFTITKGIVYCAFSRKFVEYALSSEYSKNLLEWSRDTYSPDEWYWATLQYNVQFNPPGGFRRTNSAKKFVATKTRYIGWKNLYKCMGELRHNVCIFSLEDLPELVTRNEFFLNKFLLNHDPLTYQCMEEWLDNQISLTQTVQIIHYCRLPFVIPYSVNPRCARLT